MPRRAEPSDGVTVVRRGHKVRLYPSDAQEDLLDEQAHVNRALWNLLHEWWGYVGENGKVSMRDADEVIRQGRKDLDWLAALPAQAAQQTLKWYLQAWKAHWAGVSRKPKYHGRAYTRMSVDVPQAQHLQVKRLSRRWGQVRLTKVGRVKFRWTRDMPGRVTGARLVKEPNGWHIAFRCEVETATPPLSNLPATGIDRGIAVPLALSDGTHYVHEPWLSPVERKRKVRLERKAARQLRAKEPGALASERYLRTTKQIGALTARATRRRRDWQHKVTTEIARTYGYVAVENLPLKNMTASARGSVEEPGRNVRQKAGLNRSLHDQAHGITLDLLRYKVVERGGVVVGVPAHFTSQRCSACGVLGSRVGLAFTCATCGYSGHADTNAARNICIAAGWAVNGRGDDPVAGHGEASTFGTPKLANEGSTRQAVVDQLCFDFVA